MDRQALSQAPMKLVTYGDQYGVLVAQYDGPRLSRQMAVVLIGKDAEHLSAVHTLMDDVVIVSDVRRDVPSWIVEIATTRTGR